jgi:MFS family permease
MTNEPPEKFRMLGLISLAELMVMAVWFSASAVVAALTEAWTLDESGQAWLTMSVQIGFVVGAFGSAVLNLADRIPAKWLFVGSALLAGLMTALIPVLATGVGVALALRFLTGVFLAGVYPVGMKLVTTWTRKDRGFGIGLLVGALVAGSAAPFLLRALGSDLSVWQPVMVLAAALAVLGALIGAFLIQEGPYRTKTAPFNPRYAGKILSDRGTLLANLGYFGHMWELYAMWTWIALFLAESFRVSGGGAKAAALVAFFVIAIGSVGSFVAGWLADKVGRTTVTMGAMLSSGLIAIFIGRLFGGSPVLLSIVALIWGLTVVADSAQFSACVTELCEPAYIGTALTLQTSLGFLLTLVTIRLVPTMQTAFGWQGAFVFLAIGPVVGILAMAMLRRLPVATKLAGGRR